MDIAAMRLQKCRLRLDVPHATGASQSTRVQRRPKTVLWSYLPHSPAQSPEKHLSKTIFSGLGPSGWVPDSL